MFVSRRQGLVFAAGLVVGIATGAGLLLGLQHADPASKLLAEAIAQPTPPPPDARQRRAAACMFDPVLTPAADRQDGRFRMQGDAAGATESDVPAYLAVADDAAAKGRMRDAEMAYIIACRMAGHVAGADAPQLADAKYQLASHYMKAAPGMRASEGFEEVRARAETLFAESIDVFGMKLGLEHPKTRLAVAGLSSIKETLARGEAVHGVPRDLLAAKAAEAQAIASDPSIMGAGPARKKKPRPVEEEDAVASVAEPKEESVAAAPVAKAESGPEPRAESKAKAEPRPEPRAERKQVEAAAAPPPPPPSQASGEAMTGGP